MLLHKTISFVWLHIFCIVSLHKRINPLFQIILFNRVHPPLLCYKKARTFHMLVFLQYSSSPLKYISSVLCFLQRKDNTQTHQYAPLGYQWNSYISIWLFLGGNTHVCIFLSSMQPACFGCHQQKKATNHCVCLGNYLFIKVITLLLGLHYFCILIIQFVSNSFLIFMLHNFP